MVQNIYEQLKRCFYFIPDKFEHLNDSKASNLLENSKTVSSASDVSRTLPDSNVHLSSFALPCGVTGSKKENSTNGEDGITKKLSRPPNVFILYNRAKQSQTLDHHQDIPNNEIGKMWHENKRIDYDYFSCKSCKKKNWLEVGVKEKYIKSFEYSSFNNWSKIGEGGFGIVYSAYSNDVEKIVALKRLRNSDSENSFHEFIREVRNIIEVNNHDNIIRFFGITRDPSTESYYMVLQFANNGDLRNYLNANFLKLDWQTKIRMAKEISNGINYLHRTNIVHRDLHDKNILVHNDSLMITDFGLSKSLNSKSKSISGGIFAYLDPQCFQNLNYRRDKPSDIYSLSMIFWELSSGKPPFKNVPEIAIIAHVISGKREIPVDGTPVDFVNLYRNAWNCDPNSRPDITEILNELDCIKLSLIHA